MTVHRKAAVAAAAAVVVVVAIVVTAAIAGGASPTHAVNTGPFGDGGVQGNQCFVLRHPGELVTDGENSVQNSGRQTAVIDSVTPIDPHGLRLISAYAVPDGGPKGQDLYGDQPGVPPKPPLLAEWSNRQDADGARIPHGPAYRVFNLLLVMRTLGGIRSTDDGIDVRYHVGSQHYELRTGIGLEALVTSGSCP